MSAVSIRWRGGALAFASAHGDVVRVTPPDRLAEGAGCWSPEELLAAAVATSYGLAIVEAAARDDLPLVDATLKAECTATHVYVDAVLETLAGEEEAVRRAAAAQRAVVADALAVPLEIRLRVHAAESIATHQALNSLV